MSLAVEFRAQTLRHSPQGPCPLSTLAAVVQPRFKCLCECAQWLTPPQMRAHACASLMTTKYKLGRRYTTSTRRSGPPLPRTTCTRQLFGAACRVPWTACTRPCLRALVGRHAAATHECTHALGTCRYGQTGSGKTFTMLGDERAKLGPVLEATHGMLPRAMHHIFNSCAHGSSSPEVHLTAAQIYRERITDLLVESLPAPALKLRERAGEVFVDGLRSVRVRTAPEAMAALVGAASRRCTSSTVHNEVSSRSHAVFTLWIQHPGKAATQLNFVDLAGSERLDGMRGSRAEESIAINSSLLALAGVIGALTEGIAGWHSRLTDMSYTRLCVCGLLAGKGGSRRPHIPYRDSQLTRLLQNSLGGKCLTSMIATVSPTAEAAAETERTLRFGCRATYVRNRSQRPATDTARPDTLFSGKEEEMLAAARDAVLGGKDGDEGPFFNGCVEVPLAPRPRQRWHRSDLPRHAASACVWVQAHGKSKRSGPAVVCLHGYFAVLAVQVVWHTAHCPTIASCCAALQVWNWCKQRRLGLHARRASRSRLPCDWYRLSRVRSHRWRPLAITE